MGSPPVPEEAWRLFVAIPLPGEVRDALARAIEPVRRRVRGGRWQSPETWHLTLRFLGDTPTGAIPAIERAVRGTAAGHPPFRLELGRAGSFEHRRGGRIAWVGLVEGDRDVAALADGLAHALAPDEPTAPLQAHLTIARDAPEGLVEALAAALARMRQEAASAPVPGQIGLGSRLSVPRDRTAPLAWTADRLVLYRSVLGPSGAAHTPLLEAPLAG